MSAPANRLGGKIDPREWDVRCKLAACYRLVALYGWDDLLATHISARLPGEETFLVNPYGMLFEEITASSLIKVDGNGTILDESEYPINAAAFVVHSAIHAARRDVGCAIHLHTVDGIAVATLEEGLLPLTQVAMLVYRDVAVHEYEGVVLDLGERERLARDLGKKNLLLLRNHGTMALGRSVGEAFTRMYFFETACQIQVRALAMGRTLHAAAPEAIDTVSALAADNDYAFTPGRVWDALLRKLDRVMPGYAV